MAKESLLVVTERYYPEEFLINDLVRELGKEYRVEVLTQAPSYPFDRIFHGFRNSFFSRSYHFGIPVHRVRTILGYKRSAMLKIIGYIVFAMLTTFKAFQLSRRFSQVFYYHTGPATMAHSAFVLHGVFRKRCTIWTQDVWPDAIFAYGIRETRIRRAVLTWYLSRLYRNFERVAVSCPGFSRIISRYYRGRIMFIPQWYPEAGLLPSQGAEPGDLLRFVYLGNLGTSQNLPDLIAGFNIAKTSGLKAELHIVGDGVMKDTLVEIVFQDRMTDVKIWGRRPASEMPNFFRMADVMVLTLANHPLFSMYIPAKFQGYLAGGKPVYAILDGQVAEIVRENHLGVVSAPGDVAKIARGFAEFQERASEIQEMGSNSKLYYDHNYDRENGIEKLRDLLKT